MDLISERIITPELQSLYDSGQHVYSISKLNAIDHCPYEAWLSYIAKATKENNVYGFLGGRLHDQLEKIVNGLEPDASLPQFLMQTLQELEIMGYEFPKDSSGGDGIRNNWINDMMHFCTHFQKPQGQFQTEDFVLYQLGQGRYIQGYIDLIRHHGDNRISIYDWKTSSQFKKKDLLHHGRQLIIYAHIKEQQGFQVEEIAWIMMKYAVVRYTSAIDGKQNSRVVRRCHLFSELRADIDAELKLRGHSFYDRKDIIRYAMEKGTLQYLPKSIRSKYTVQPYVKKYPYTPELVKEALAYIQRVADVFENTPQEEDAWQPRSFCGRNGRADTFYCDILCSYRNTCKHIIAHRQGETTAPADSTALF